MGEAGYKQLIVWQKADQLAKQIYISTRNFPKEELYGLTSQLRRAGLSVPVNIVEGYARRSTKELQQFLNIALGSLAETEYLLKFAFDLKFINDTEYESVEKTRQEVGNLLWRFIQSVK
ncbi:MAG: four helix bundle protein [Candidatus Omnitrophica bacterium]|nr:four helix bundle protein [Candidatus Omnitrophota bacterium]